MVTIVVVTIITEAFFWFTVMKIHDSQGITKDGGGYFFNSSWGTNFFRQKIYGEVVLSGRTNDQIMPKWVRSFINDKCIFQ